MYIYPILYPLFQQLPTETQKQISPFLERIKQCNPKIAPVEKPLIECLSAIYGIAIGLELAKRQFVKKFWFIEVNGEYVKNYEFPFEEEHELDIPLSQIRAIHTMQLCAQRHLDHHEEILDRIGALGRENREEMPSQIVELTDRIRTNWQKMVMGRADLADVTSKHIKILENSLVSSIEETLVERLYLINSTTHDDSYTIKPSNPDENNASWVAKANKLLMMCILVRRVAF